MRIIVQMAVRHVINVEYLLETVQGAWRGHAGHTGAVDSTELNLRHIEGDGG